MAVITLSSVPQPTLWHDVPSVTLSDETLQQRKAKVLSRMVQQGLDTLVIYADKEHGGNLDISPGLSRALKRRS